MAISILFNGRISSTASAWKMSLVQLLLWLTVAGCSAFQVTSGNGIDTAGWIGAEYTPAAAPGNGWGGPVSWSRLITDTCRLWWHWYDAYAPSVTRELTYLSGTLKFTTIRVWLHTMVYADDPAGLHSNMDRFLDVASSHGIKVLHPTASTPPPTCVCKVGFVFFGDCFNHAGANLTHQCLPVKGRHNGCWMASPQDFERTRGSYDKFQAYVTSTVARFKDDARVQWWEVFNEPRRDDYSLGLRDAGYKWATAVQPLAPVISCWDDSNDTMIVDHHDYGTAFKSEWLPRIYSNPSKGAIVTEAGSRWFQVPFKHVLYSDRLTRCCSHNRSAL